MRALAIAGLVSGALSTTVGTTQLSAAYTAPDLLAKDRLKLGLFGAVLVAAGITVSSLASYELARGREARA